jgi:glycosyltransferase involved in cell wall biosynthesis
MKVLYLCADLGIPVLGRKGAAVHVRSLVTALGRAGHSVVLAAAQLNKSPWGPPESLDVPVLHLGLDPEAHAAVLAVKAFSDAITGADSLPGEFRRILLNKEAVRQLRRRFEDDPPDFLYERASLYGTAGAMLAGEFTRPLLVELNAPLAIEQPTYRGTRLGDLAARAERWLLTRADAVLVVSDALRDYVAGLGVPSGRIHTVPNGVDEALFRPDTAESGVRKRFDLGAGPLLGFVGGMRPWHGVEVLPALLGRLARRHPDLRLVIVGDGPLRGELERELRERDLARAVIFTGSVPHEDVPALIRQFDVALAPYPVLEHPFYYSPLKLFEYMACGAPVVAAALGQISEVVQDGETGLLYQPGDDEALATACNRLLADPALGRRLGQAAARQVHQRYTWNHIAARVAEVGRSLLRKGKAGA